MGRMRYSVPVRRSTQVSDIGRYRSALSNKKNVERTITKASIASISRLIRGHLVVQKTDADTHLPRHEICGVTCLPMALGAGTRCFTAPPLDVDMGCKAQKPPSKDWTMRDDISKGGTQVWLRSLSSGSSREFQIKSKYHN